jgi:hypothetical protein
VFCHDNPTWYADYLANEYVATTRRRDTMYTIVVWATNESMPEEFPAEATTLTQAKAEADRLYPNADTLVITKTGSKRSLANRSFGEPWPPAR